MTTRTGRRIALLWAAALALGAAGAAHATVRPYLVDVTGTSARIRFTSDQSPNVVEWGIGALANTTPVTTIIDNELDTLFQQALLEVQLTGLSPSTVYQYRVVRGAVPDATHTFTTAVNPGEAFSFGAYGDNRTGVGGVAGGGAHADHKAVADAMAAQAPDFVVNTADHMDADVLLGDDVFQPWDDFFAQEQNLLPKTPTYNARGNHDDSANFWVQLFSIPGDPGTGYRSFDYGNAHFVIVNTNESVAVGSPQYAFIQADLAANEGQGPLFAFHHHGCFSNGVHGGNSGPHDNLAPLYQRYGVDVVYQGHDHVYTRYQPINGVNYLVTGGGGAPTYPVNFQNQAPIVVTQSTLNYVITTVTGNTISVVARKPNGTQLDSFVVDAATNDGVYSLSDPLPPKGDGVSVPGCSSAPGAGAGASSGGTLALYGIPVLAMALSRRRA